MTSRYSPPPFPSKTIPQTSGRAMLPRRSRYVYVALTLLLLYLWLTGHSPTALPSLRYKNVDWSRYAYFQYATSTASLCNSIMVFEALDRLSSKADRILLYPEEWDLQIESPTDRDSQLLVKARDWYKVKLVPVNIPVTYDRGQEAGEVNATFTQFMAWEQTRYERVLHLDSDITVLKHMDDLFLLPSAPVAMMRAHWTLPKRTLASNLIILQPSEEEYERLMSANRPDSRQAGDTNTDVLNRFYADSAMILPHKAYGLLTSEFRVEDHKNYIGNTHDPWDPERALQEASLVHFLDEPFPKPWIMWPHALYAEKHPRCKAEDCRDKDTWASLYNDFRKRRKVARLISSSRLPS